MTEQTTPLAASLTEVERIARVDQPAVQVDAPAVDAEHARQVEMFFAHTAQQYEADTVANIWGLWASAVLLTDLTVEHFDQREEHSAPSEHPEPDDK